MSATLRTLIYVFLLDSGFVIFYNFPPRLVVQEANVSLVCPEACFQAQTAAECEAYVRMWTSHRLYQPSLSLSSAIEILCRRSVSQYHRDVFIELGSVNLMIIATGERSSSHLSSLRYTTAKEEFVV